LKKLENSLRLFRDLPSVNSYCARKKIKIFIFFSRLFRDLKQPPFIFAADLIFKLLKTMAAIIIFICIFSLADMLTKRA